jgi:hypothetical protein
VSVLVEAVLVHENQSLLLIGGFLLVGLLKVLGAAGEVIYEVEAVLRGLLEQFEIEVAGKPGVAEVELAAGHRVRLPDDHVRYYDALGFLVEEDLQDSPVVGLGCW